MNYPTLEEVAAASRIQICEWVRFLPSPGSHAFDKTPEEFYKVMKAEAAVMDAIHARFTAPGGGMTPAISKAIGWDKP